MPKNKSCIAPVIKQWNSGSQAVLLLLVILSGNLCCCLLAQPQPNDQQASSQQLQQLHSDPSGALQTMQQAGLLLSEQFLARGFKGASPGAGRMWRTLAQKLSTPGRIVHITPTSRIHCNGPHSPLGVWWLKSSVCVCVCVCVRACVRVCMGYRA
jgi:hypothetical protein